MIKLARVILASALLIAPLPVQGADLTIWWTKGFYPAEEEGIRRVVEDFQKETGTSIDLTLYTQTDIPVKLLAALTAGQPPDLAYSVGFGPHLQRWAYEGRLVDLDDIVEPIAGSIDPAVLDAAHLPNGQTGQRAYYSLPIVWASIHMHIWRSLLEQAGIGVDEIPHEWGAFWDFFCDRVQPAVRKATGRREIYGMGLPVSTAGTDTNEAFSEFLLAHDAWFIGADGKPAFDEPGKRERITAALEDFARPAKKGCNPPGAVSWDNPDNNANFLNQTIVMTPNGSLPIPGSQRASNSDNYFKNIATIEWPRAVDGSVLPVQFFWQGVSVFTAGRNLEGAKAFLRYLSRPERLGPYVEAGQGRWFPALRELADTPFWTDLADPHRATLRRQMTDAPRRKPWGSQDLKFEQVFAEKVWPRAVARVVVEGWTAERAADEAIARTKEIVSE